MANFADTVQNARLREQLASTLQGKGVFRRFKDVLRDYPDEEAAWYTFHDESIKREVRDWLASIGIEPVEEPKKGRS
jgi:hypothetical protein